jgi:hypothetical protein
MGQTPKILADTMKKPQKDINIKSATQTRKLFNIENNK